MQMKMTRSLKGLMILVVLTPTLAFGEGGEGLTKGILDGKKPMDSVQLVGKQGHIMVPEKKGAKSLWEFANGVLTASPQWDSVITPVTYSDFRLHLEFNVNHRPGTNPEKSGNSGVYIQQRYELQISDAHGVPAEDYKASYCGSMYRQKTPDKLVAKPAGEWQSYDIVFRAARFVDGKRTEQARITVMHNGVLIHDDYALKNKTGAGKKEGPEPGPIKLQGHQNKVKFRNVWIQRLKLEPKKEGVAKPEKKKKGYTYVIPFDEIPPSPVLSPKEALASFKLHEDFEISTVAHEPAVESPLALRFDEEGRMWVVEMRGYMLDAEATGEADLIGRISVHEDTNGDGVYDKSSVFLDGLNQPRSIAFYKGGVLYGGHEKLYFVENKNGKAGKMTVIDEDYTQDGNVEHRTNALMRGLDNWIYNVKSDTRYREIDGKWVKEKTTFRGQWGMSQDNYGRLYYNQNWVGLEADQLLPNTLRRNRNYLLSRNHGTRLSYRDKLFPARVTPGVNRGGEGAIDDEGYLTAVTGATGPVAYRGDQFPPEFRNVGLFCEPAAHLVRLVHVGREDGLSYGEHLMGEREFLASTDERFRPVNLFTAPDGTLCMIDMYHGIIQHKRYLTRYLREHIAHRGLESHPQGGRIYRIKYKGNPRGPRPQMVGRSATELVSFLAHPNGWWRDTAQRLIVDSGSADAVPALTEMASQEESPLGQLHALWCLEGLGQLNEKAIRGGMSSGNPFVVESAIRLSAHLPQEKLVGLMPRFEHLASSNDPVIVRELAASLGRVPSTEALVLLKRILIENLDLAYVRELVISGLEGRETEFQAVLGPDFKDGKFLEYLKHCLTLKTTAAAYKPPRDKKHLESFKRGEKFYIANCMACHGPDGGGMEMIGPPMVKSEWVLESDQRLAAILLQGLKGPIEVAGKHYTPAAEMPGLKDATQVTDANLADVATFVRYAWNNRKGPVKVETVSAVRKKLADRQSVFTPEEVKKEFP